MRAKMRRQSSGAARQIDFARQREPYACLSLVHIQIVEKFDDRLWEE